MVSVRKIFAVAFGFLLALYFLGAPFIVPFVAERLLKDVLAPDEGQELTVDWGIFNAFTFDLSAQNLLLKQQDGTTFIDLPRLSANLAPANLARGEILLRSGQEASLNIGFEGEDTTLQFENWPMASLPTLLGAASRIIGGRLGGTLVAGAGGDLTAEFLTVENLLVQTPSEVTSFHVGHVKVNGLAVEGSGTSIEEIAGEQLELAFESEALPLPRLEIPTLAGSIKVAAMPEHKPASIDLKGRLIDESGFGISGTIATQGATSLRVAASADKVGHEVLSPLVWQFLGRASDAGALYLDLELAIEEGQIDGVANLVFDQWKWGAQNPDFAYDPLPLKAAFDILQGKGGRVRMSVPFSGDATSPDFHVDAIVRRATRRVIGDVVGAPFKLLGALVPGGGSDLELDKIRFVPGAFNLQPLHRAKLDALATALQERPMLSLRIEGRAMEVADGATVAEIEAMAQQRAEAVKSYLVAAGVAPERLELTTRLVEENKSNPRPSVRLSVRKNGQR